MLDMNISGSVWSFVANELSTGPVLPLHNHGCIYSGNGKQIYHALDLNWNIWLGLKKTGEHIILEQFDFPIAMDVIYNYNIIEWVRFVDKLPKDLYLKYQHNK